MLVCIAPCLPSAVPNVVHAYSLFIPNFPKAFPSLSPLHHHFCLRLSLPLNGATSTQNHHFSVHIRKKTAPFHSMYIWTKTSEKQYVLIHAQQLKTIWLYMEYFAHLKYWPSTLKLIGNNRSSCGRKFTFYCFPSRKPVFQAKWLVVDLHMASILPSFG